MSNVTRFEKPLARKPGAAGRYLLLAAAAALLTTAVVVMVEPTAAGPGEPPSEPERTFFGM
jgi:hypothetical protein